MDKNAIKRYAIWARRELIEKISQKALQFGIEDGKPLDPQLKSVNGVLFTDIEIKQRQALITKIAEEGFSQVIEEVAYTWFNRFVALRFMEVNGYLPSHIRVFTDDKCAYNPQIISEALHLEIEGLDKELVMELKTQNKNEELFRYLLIAQCNELSFIIPQMFQKLSDYSELLLPDFLLRNGSVIEQLVSQIPEEDWLDQVQIIGWLYQYYNSEKKDEVFAALKKKVKISKENVPAATQLFTPDWIVRYMVQNSVGRIWNYSHENQKILDMEYYDEEIDQDAYVQEQINNLKSELEGISPESIKIIDPCAGSGHVLVYVFDVLVKIYEQYGYTSRDAATKIIENNIYGLDIDERAAQLTAFTILMKARQYDRRLFSKIKQNDDDSKIGVNIFAIRDSNHIDPFLVDYFSKKDEHLHSEIMSVLAQLKDAREYGSLLICKKQDWEALHTRLRELDNEIDLWSTECITKLKPLIIEAEILSSRFDCVITNPPYMGSNGMSPLLSQFVKSKYPDTKSDMFACFIERAFTLAKETGVIAMITQHAWMFLSSYEKLRGKINAKTIISMAHLGPRAFDEIAGEVVQTTSFVLLNRKIDNYAGSYYRLLEGNNETDKKNLFLRKTTRFSAKQEDFCEIPGSPVAYWVTEKFIKDFEDGINISKYMDSFQGIITGDNNKFLRYWFEVNLDNICLNASNMRDVDLSRQYWIPYNKGGEFRKWYGNQDYVVFWKNGPDDKTRGKKTFEDYYLREYVSWSYITTTTLAARYFPNGFLWDVSGSGFFDKSDMLYYLQAFISSKVGIYFLNVINPTINYQVENILQLPIIESKEHKDEIDRLVKENIDMAKADWDSFEVSWEFKTHPLLKYGSGRISDAFSKWEEECKLRYQRTNKNEQRLNELFIEIYGLNSELNPEVDDTTIRLADPQREIKSLISYAVGCMFGRYSLSTSGLRIADIHRDNDTMDDFVDRDNIIPITDDEYFQDDIVTKFVTFVGEAFGNEYLDENLQYVSNVIGGKGSPKENLRDYFENAFYQDHVKIYQKRPIYWQFDSGKKNGFKCLTYIMRYRNDTVARVRTDYVHELQARLKTAIDGVENQIVGASGNKKIQMTHDLARLKEQAEEVHLFEEHIHHIADQMIELDLDKGVADNYKIFKDVLTKI